MLGEPMAVTLLVVKAFETLDIRYLIGGSLASAIHGVVRATLDSDVVADVRLEHAEALARSLQDAFYVDEAAIRDAVRHRNSFNVIHLETMFKVDVFIPPDRPFDRTRFERRIAHVVSDDPARTVYVSSAEDTILAKLEWYRAGGGVSARQWGDVQGILKAQRDRLDYASLRYWAGELQVTDLLDRALGEAGIE